MLGPDPYEEIEKPFAPFFFFKTPFKFAATKYLNQMIIKRKNVYIITCEVPTGEEGPEGILNTFLKEKPLEL